LISPPPFGLPQKRWAFVVLDGVNISYPVEFFQKYTKRKIIGKEMVW